MMPRKFKYLFHGHLSFERIIASVVIATGLVWLFYFGALIFDLPTGHWWRYFALPGSWHTYAGQPWSILTYAWVHTGLIGFFINLLLLYYLGNLFLTFESEKKLIRLFWTGIISGATAFLLSVKLLPFFYSDEQNIYLTGISAGYMIWLAYLAKKYGDYRFHLRLAGEVKIKHVFFFFLIIDLLLLNTQNSGGHIAHLASMLAGWIWGTVENKRINKKQQQLTREPKIYNNLKTATEKRIDRILDKINKSGFESLSKEEKEILYRESKRQKDR